MSSDKSARKSDGRTQIVDGRTSRLDENRCKWTSTFIVDSDTEVKMISVADPSDAHIDFFLTTPNGIPTRSPLTYQSILRYSRRGEQIQMSGQVDHGGEIVFITMRKIVEDGA